MQPFRPRELASDDQAINSIAERVLYTTIITDKLPLLFRNIASASGRRRLAHTRRLLIEYSPSLQTTSPSYKTLLKSGGEAWARVGQNLGGIKVKIAKQCIEENGQLQSALEWVAMDMGMVGRVFPKLEAVATASIYGKEDNRWRIYQNHLTESREAMAYFASSDCIMRFFMFVNALPSLRQLCVRNPNGPFSVPQNTHATQAPPVNYDRTIHYSADLDEVYVPWGKPIRWTSDAPSNMPWQFVGESLAQEIDRIQNIRRDKAAYDPRWQDPRNGLDVEIYCSTAGALEVAKAGEEEIVLQRHPGWSPLPDFKARRMPVEEQRKLAAGFGNNVQTESREDFGEQDRIRWFASPDMPVCVACGSGPPA